MSVESIDWAIIDFVRSWKHLEVVGESSLDELERDFWDWQHFFSAPYESWKSLAATPDELLLAFENMRDSRQALSSAMIGLNKRERQMIAARFLRQPRQTLNSIARDHKISYARTVFIIKQALKKLGEAIRAIEKKRDIDGLSVFDHAAE